MKIGIFIDTQKESGGIYQYCLSFIQALIIVNLKDNFFLFSPKNTLKKEKIILKKLRNWKIIDFKKRNQKKAIKFYKIRRFLGSIYDNLINSTQPPKLKKIPLDFNKYQIDLMLYPAAFSYDFFKLKIPFIVCIHDLQHRLNPNFPEVSRRGECQKREYMVMNYLREAKLVIAESRTGRKQIQRFYKIDPKKIKVLPYTIPTYLLTIKITNNYINKVKEKYNITKPYIFYPAQFWPHKNHQLIIKALKILSDQGININVIFVGSKQEKWGEYDRIMKLIKKYNLQDQISYLGFITDKEMVVLYKGALCLVMPTFFGPSNIPPLEAFYLGCPVVTSNIEGLREQIGEAGFLIDRENETDLAKAIKKILLDKRFRSRLILRGSQKISKWQPRDFARKLKKIIKEAIC